MIQYNMVLHASVKDAEYKSEFKYTKCTPYLALMGELWVSLVRIVEKINRVITTP